MQVIVIMYEAISAEFQIENMLPRAAVLPILRRAMIKGSTKEKKTALMGISYVRYRYRKVS
jgi:hypothetical protein